MPTSKSKPKAKKKAAEPKLVVISEGLWQRFVEMSETCAGRGPVEFTWGDPITEHLTYYQPTVTLKDK